MQERANGATMARNDLAVKMDAEVVKKAKVIALNRDISLAEYLSERIRPLVERDYKQELAKMSASAGGKDPDK